MIKIKQTSEEQILQIPVSRSIGSRPENHTLTLVREGTGVNVNVEIKGCTEMRDYTVITIAQTIDDGEWEYYLDNIDCGILQVGEYCHTPMTYNDDKQIIFYDRQ